MAKGANVASVSSVQDLLVALLNFWPRCNELLDEARKEGQRGLQELESREDYWKNELRRRQAEYDDADREEDDLGNLARRVEEAEDAWRLARNSVRRIEEANLEFDRCAGRLMGEQNEKAIGFLRRRIQEMEEYLSTPLDQIEFVQPRIPGIIDNLFMTAQGVASRGVGFFTDNILPAGFEWIPLESISPREIAELPDDAEYNKIKKPEMQRGFFVLQTLILPRIQELGNSADNDYFRLLDENGGIAREGGSSRVYEAFFGDEPIEFERALDGQHYDLANGRHRVKVAMELGWTHVPGRVIGKD